LTGAPERKSTYCDLKGNQGRDEKPLKNVREDVRREKL